MLMLMESCRVYQDLPSILKQQQKGKSFKLENLIIRQVMSLQKHQFQRINIFNGLQKFKKIKKRMLFKQKTLIHQSMNPTIQNKKTFLIKIIKNNKMDMQSNHCSMQMKIKKILSKRLINQKICLFKQCLQLIIYFKILHNNRSLATATIKVFSIR